MSAIKNILTKLYGVRMNLSKLTGIGINIARNDKKIKPSVSFYSLTAKANNGEEISFEIYRSKKVLLVNLASQCGYTPQYNELEKLHEQYNESVTVLGFPSNDFGGQEPGTDEEIANFCKVNFGVTFQLFHKDVVKGNDKQPVYDWLSNTEKNGWNNAEPSWNFCKYLVNENGELTHFFNSSVSPLSDVVLNAIRI